ncbi:von willebrand factor type A domain protein [Ceratobasidium sp. AG-Ba]|nr:von willebrand factor type A domain protein [Ceratobasidium sp. AG-Ba]
MLAKLKQKFKSPATDKDVARDMEREEALTQLGRYDTQFLIDDSRSMGGSRWQEARDALAGLAKIALKYDNDGIEIFFLNAVDSGRTVKASFSDEDVRQLFASVRQSPGTPTGRRLNDLLTAYINKLETAGAKSIKPLNLIVITDGEPSDDPASVIVEAARRLDEGKYPLAQVGIQFIQVGDDSWASKALKDLDNHLGTMNSVRDIVDTRPYTGQPLTAERLITMLLGGINRRVDRLENV